MNISYFVLICTVLGSTISECYKNKGSESTESGSKPLSLELLTTNKLKELQKVLQNTQAVSHVVKQEPDDLMMAKKILVDAIISGKIEEINLDVLSKEKTQKPVKTTTTKKYTSRTTTPKRTTLRPSTTPEDVSWEYETDPTTRTRRPTTSQRTVQRTTRRRTTEKPEDYYDGEYYDAWTEATRRRTTRRTTRPRPDFLDSGEATRRRTTRRTTRPRPDFLDSGEATRRRTTTRRRRPQDYQDYDYPVEVSRPRTTRRTRRTTRRTTTPEYEEYDDSVEYTRRWTTRRTTTRRQTTRRQTTRRQTTRRQTTPEYQDYDDFVEFTRRRTTRRTTRRSTTRPQTTATLPDYDEFDRFTRRRTTRRTTRQRTTTDYQDYDVFDEFTRRRTTRRSTRRTTERPLYEDEDYWTTRRRTTTRRRRTTRRRYDLYDQNDTTQRNTTRRRRTRRRTTKNLPDYDSNDQDLTTRRSTRRTDPRTTRRQRTTTRRVLDDPFADYDTGLWDVQPAPKRTDDDSYGTYKPRTKKKKCKTACKTCPFATRPLENIKYNVEVGTNENKNLVIKPSVMIYGSSESQSKDFYEESGDVLANQYRDYMLQIKMPRKSKSKRRKTKKVRARGSGESNGSDRHFFPDEYGRRHHRSLQPAGSSEPSDSFAASGEGPTGDVVASKVWEDDGVLNHLLRAAKDLSIDLKRASE